MSGTVLVGFDGRSPALDALVLAQALVPEPDELVVCCVYPAEVGDHGTAKRDEAERRLHAARHRLGGVGGVRFVVRPAFSPAEGLHAEAEACGADLLVVGSSHRGPPGRIVPGSVTRQALHAAPCPVAVAPLWLQSAGEVPLTEIGVAYDGGAPARAALQHAAAVAQTTGGTLHVVTVNAAGERGWASDWVWPPAEQPDARAMLEREGLVAVRELTPAVPACIDIRRGSPAGELAAASVSLDLLVIGSRGYGPVRRVLLGSVSEAVSASAMCSLLVVPRPADAAATAHRLARSPA